MAELLLRVRSAEGTLRVSILSTQSVKDLLDRVRNDLQRSHVLMEPASLQLHREQHMKDAALEPSSLINSLKLEYVFHAMCDIRAYRRSIGPHQDRKSTRLNSSH